MMSKFFRFHIPSYVLFKKMMSKFFVFLLIVCQATAIEAQKVNLNKFDVFVKNSIELSEQALYNSKFDEALHFVDYSYFENFEAYQSKHKIALTIQSIRIRSFQARLRQLSFNSDEHLSSLLNLQPIVEKLDDEILKAKFFIMLSGLYGSKNPDLCILYETKALGLFKSKADYKSVAELQATQISRELDSYFRENKREEAIAMIQRFRKEINFSSKYSKYALAYNTRHLANIYRIYEIDHKEALKLYRQSLDLREEIGFTPFITASYYSLGIVYSNLGMQEKAISAYKESIEQAKNVHFIRYEYLPYLSIGDIYLTKENKEKAKEYYLKALKSASLNNYTNGINNAIEKINNINN